MAVDKDEKITAEIREGWRENEEGDSYYYRKGVLVKGEFVKDSAEEEAQPVWYFTDRKTGAMVKNDWAYIEEPNPYNDNRVEKVWYHMGADGKMQRGRIEDESGWKRYNLDSNGRMRINMWVYAEEQEALDMPEGYYHLMSDGAVQMNGWAQSVNPGIWWFCNPVTGAFKLENPES